MKALDIDEMTALLHDQKQWTNLQPVVLTVAGEPYAAFVPLASLKNGLG